MPDPARPSPVAPVTPVAGEGRPATTPRRAVLGALAAAPGLLLGATRARGAESEEEPFRLGVASGYPQADGFVAWTRLARAPLAADGGMGVEPIAIVCEVAADEAFRHVVRRERALARPSDAHSVRVAIRGLEADRWYWYRFEAVGHRSRSGRCRTAPGPGADSGWRLAIASCAHYEQGWFAAYRAIANDAPDLVVHLGDYIYESSWGKRKARHFDSPEPKDLDAYRRRYALYRMDPDLQEAHAACAWVSTWDDHEVANDYANDQSQRLDPPAEFLARRAAAYRAYFEHMPLPVAMAPQGPSARVYHALRLGERARIILLDDRQYRSAQACPRPGRGGSNVVRPDECADLADPARTMLGAGQERWLGGALAGPDARWTLVAQQTLLAPMNLGSAARPRYWTDGWSGYPAARQRLIDQVASSGARNPVVLGGDVHCFYVADLHRRCDDPRSPLAATEFVGTSITSESRPQDWIDKAMRENPHVRYGNGEHRGYLRLDLGARSLQADLIAVDDVHDARSSARPKARFVVADGRPGAQRDG